MEMMWPMAGHHEIRHGKAQITKNLGFSFSPLKIYLSIWWLGCFKDMGFKRNIVQ